MHASLLISSLLYLTCSWEKERSTAVTYVPDVHVTPNQSLHMFAAFADVQFASTPRVSDVIAAASSSKAKLTLGGGGGGDGQATLRPVLE
jgi:hypothetical protein